MPFFGTNDYNHLYAVTLGNGKRFTKLRLNGNNFVSEEEITKEDFEGGLYSVDITDGVQDWHMEDVKLDAIQQHEDGWYFVLSEKSYQEKQFEALQSNLEYLAMMTDVDL